MTPIGLPEIRTGTDRGLVPRIVAVAGPVVFGSYVYVGRRNKWNRTIGIFLLQWESEKLVSPVPVLCAAATAWKRRGRTAVDSWAGHKGRRGGGPEI